MIPPELINQEAYKLNDSQLFECLKDSIFQALQMLSLQTKPEHASMVFYGSVHIIRKKFNDFTAGQLDTALQMGLYGNYGEFSKVNPKTLLEWFSRRRLEISHEKEIQEYYKNRTEDKDFVLSSYGGHAVLLGLFYDSIGINEPFKRRLYLIENDAICEHTKKKVRKLVEEYIAQNKMAIGKKII
jgi:hypothetical protein